MYFFIFASVLLLARANAQQTVSVPALKGDAPALRGNLVATDSLENILPECTEEQIRDGEAGCNGVVKHRKLLDQFDIDAIGLGTTTLLKLAELWLGEFGTKFIDELTMKVTPSPEAVRFVIRGGKILKTGTMKFKGAVEDKVVLPGHPNQKIKLWTYEFTIRANKDTQGIDVLQEAQHVFALHKKKENGKYSDIDQEFGFGFDVDLSIYLDDEAEDPPKKLEDDFLVVKDTDGKVIKDKEGKPKKKTKKERCEEYEHPTFVGKPHHDCLKASELEIVKQEVFSPTIGFDFNIISIWRSELWIQHEDDAFAGGEPHFRTWNGDWFDYMGACDLVLLLNRAFAGGLGLAVHIRTRARYGYSYIESAALRIGNDTLEVSSFGSYAVNGVDAAYLGGEAGMLSGFPIHHTHIMNKKKHVFDVVIGETQNITLAAFKDLVSVEISEEGRHFLDGSVGLMGDYNTGRMLGRDGSTEIEEPVAFGQEWQVLDTEPMLFQSVNGPQYPEKCVLPHLAAAQERRLGEVGVTREAAKEACAHHATEETTKNCIFDVMATGDLDMALN